MSAACLRRSSLRILAPRQVRADIRRRFAESRRVAELEVQHGAREQEPCGDSGGALDCRFDESPCLGHVSKFCLQQSELGPAHFLPQPLLLDLGPEFLQRAQRRREPALGPQDAAQVESSVDPVGRGRFAIHHQCMQQALGVGPVAAQRLGLREPEPRPLEIGFDLECTRKVACCLFQLVIQLRKLAEDRHAERIIRFEHEIAIQRLACLAVLAQPQLGLSQVAPQVVVLRLLLQ